MIGKIYGTGSYVPPDVIDNNNLANMVETSDAWIRERTGIARRHIAKEENAAAMAAKAAESALKAAGIGVEEIEFIIVATMTSDVILPCAACEVQKAIGAVNAVCFDLNAACSGFLFAYQTAQAYIASGTYQCGLVIGAECLSKLVDWKDRTTCILFGDGAGAVVLKGEARDNSLSMKSYSDGSKGGALTCEQNSRIRMDGQAVFKFAVKRVPECILGLLEEKQIPVQEVDYFILHQANRRIVEAVARKLKQPVEKFPMNLEEYGNTSSASIPLLLDELNRQGRLKRGMKIVVAGFGAGLSWGASYLEW